MEIRWKVCNIGSASTSIMTEQQRLLRLIKLMELLASTRRRSVSEYATLLVVDRSTVYRYLETIEAVGYPIHRDDQKRPFLDRSALRREHPSLSFTAEESSLLSGLVRAYDSPLQSDLLNKIYVYSAQSEVLNGLIDARRAVKYRTLCEAIEQKKQVVLKQYVSVNSGQAHDRRVEPIHFRDDNTTLEAYDIEKKGIRYFQLERIEEVKLSNKRFKYTKEHQPQDTDPFQIANLPMVEVELELSLAAAQQMKERYPATKAHLKKRGNHFLFCAPVNKQFKLLDAFLMGCCREVHILHPKSLTKHLEQQWQQRTF